LWRFCILSFLNSAETCVRTELGGNERLLWSGRPRKGIVFRAVDLFLVPFSLLWGGFAIFWEFSVLASDAPPFFVAWGIPFVLAGLYLIFGRFLMDARQRERTCYGVTNERVIIVSGLFRRSVKSLNLRTLSGITMDQRADGSGTITFGPAPPWSWWYSGIWWPGIGQQAPPRFELIQDVKVAYEIVRKAQREAT
jgi:hypothetical protein